MTLDSKKPTLVSALNDQVKGKLKSAELNAGSIIGSALHQHNPSTTIRTNLESIADHKEKIKLPVEVDYHV